MAHESSPSPPSPDHDGAGPSEEGSGSQPGSPKPHLSEEQKKANHIASEKKRRTNIREQYDKLAEMTPGMEGQGRSEGKVLEEAVKHGRVMKEERRQLIEKIEAKGGTVSQELKQI
jgi:heteromeric Ino2p/Ino4p transcription factor